MHLGGASWGHLGTFRVSLCCIYGVHLGVHLGTFRVSLCCIYGVHLGGIWVHLGGA